MKTSTCRKTSPLTILIESTQTRQPDTREKVFERQFPFSWSRFTLGMISLGLVFSDIPRSGLGISSTRIIYPSLQPDEMLGFGTSWNYSVFESNKSDAFSGNKTARVWSYKFDSTSIVWRAFARFLAVTAFPECFFYSNVCPHLTFGGDVAFKMIDALIDSISNVKKSRRKGTVNSAIPVQLTLRTENEYIDRFHHLLLPTWFTNVNWRTNQALYYPPELLSKKDMNICFPSIGKGANTPRFCQELWINYNRSGPDAKNRSVGLLYTHTLARFHDMQTRFPNMTIDLTFLESQEDVQVSRVGLGLLGYRRSDISTIIRARQCTTGTKTKTISCETMYVQDYRYETGLISSDVTDWYRLAAGLRIIGQSYFWLRGFGLMLSCCFVFGTVKWENKVKILQLFMTMPKQCVVYGSPFPVMCYVLAHLIDAAFMYEMLKSRFFTQAGVADIDIRSFLSYAVIQMRNVWVFAFIWHLIMTISQSLTHNNRLSRGIIGVQSLFLSTMSSLTIAAQYRSLTFRCSKISKIFKFPSTIGRSWGVVKYQYGFVHRGRGSSLLGGVFIDLKFLICFVFGLLLVWIIRAFYLKISNRKQSERNLYHSNWFVLAATPVPYSAGVLWPTTSMSVYWASGHFWIQDKVERQTLQLQHSRQNFSQKLCSFRWSSTDRVVVPFIPSFKVLQKQSNDYNRRVQRKVNTLRLIQHQMKTLHERSEQVEATVTFMNAIHLSDPLVYLHIVLCNDRTTQLGYYQSLWRPHQVVLLPTLVVGEQNEYTSGFKLLRRVHASELTWSELVQCG